MPPELTRFLDNGPPPIVFTLGSSAVWVARDFFRESIDAAKRLGRRAVLLIGDERNLPRLRSRRSNGARLRSVSIIAAEGLLRWSITAASEQRRRDCSQVCRL